MELLSTFSSFKSLVEKFQLSTNPTPQDTTPPQAQGSAPAKPATTVMAEEVSGPFRGGA